MSPFPLLRPLVIAVALALGIAAIPSAFAQPGPPTTQRGNRGPGGAGPAQSLEGNMKAMNRAFKTIGRQIDDATKDESTIKLAGDLESATAAAKGLLPDQLEAMEGDAKAKAAADYRRMMLQSLKDAIEMEEALIAGNREGAKAAYAKIDQQMRDGHKAYRVDHDH